MTVETKDITLPSTGGGFASGYKPGVVGGDEMIEPDGGLRPHWRMFVNLLDDLGPEELPGRWEQARRLIRENGITHNVYGDPNGLDRPWNLDMVPLLLPESQWKEVSEALVQRATLLDALMADLYGPAKCVAEGLLPAELLYNNPGYLRACHGIPVPRGRWLHLYAADIVRSADGRFRVLSDRTQAPSGAGYSLENRIVLSGILPAVFNQCNVHRLAPFFFAMRRMLTSIARVNCENPRVVLLTPGPYNETYFEHAYLARYLGYTLVQGNDLTVRDARVYLKTLGGLQRVDVILRRVDDDYCDPLELYHHSFLGVPGLVEAVRQGNVAVANALGTGVLQTPAFLSFLPALCRRLLGEELKMSSVQTWWCGNRDSLRYVLENVSKLVIKPAFPTPGSDPRFGEELSKEHLAQLVARVTARPGDFVAQEHVASPTAPVLLNERLQPRRIVVRAYLAESDGSYTVMPGGLTRVTAHENALIVSLQKGGGSKDTWVLADHPVTETTLLSTTTHSIELSRGGGDLPSRVADDLFWLGRYVQRAEGDVRVARCLFGRLMDHSRGDTAGAASMLALSMLGPTGIQLEDSRTQALVAEIFGPNGAAGLRRSIDHVQDLVRSLRDRITADAWRILQTIDRDLSEFDVNHDKNQSPGVMQLLNRLTVNFLAFGGVVADSMTRGQAWLFLDLGTRLERAIVVARLVRSTLSRVMPDESAVLDAVLEAADSSLTYRSRYLTQLDASAVVDLLVADETNPRAVAYQVAAIEEHLKQLPCEVDHPQRSPHTQLVLELRTKLRLANLRVACQPGKDGLRTKLDAMLTETIKSLEELAELISQIYFSHAAVARRLAGLGEQTT
jgi:uncharacterized circularly permuted ATP-grasp superfamily protein/uncharacterized alpha-E superfamily protein